MAITKSVITSGSEMKAFLEASGFFGSVTIDGLTNISCYDEDSNKVFGTSNYGANWEAYADTNNYKRISNLGWSCTGYSTSKGILLIPDGDNKLPCIISKTNNGAYCTLLPGTGIAYVNTNNVCTTDVQFAVGWGDVSPFYENVYSGVAASPGTKAGLVVSNQTILCPIPTRGGYGEPSYFADAYFMPVSQYRTEGVIDINGVKYVTDGIACLRDA